MRPHDPGHQARDGVEATLTGLRAAIVEDLARREIESFPSLPAVGQPAAVVWPGADWRAFLDLAERLQVRLVYLEADLFDDDTLRRLAGEAEGSFDDVDQDLLSEARARLGQLASVAVGFAHGGVLHQWRQLAAWPEELYDRLAELRYRHREATVDRLADELIASPVFVAATNDLGRELAALAASPEIRARLTSWGHARDHDETYTVALEAIRKATHLVRFLIRPQRVAELEQQLPELADELAARLPAVHPQSRANYRQAAKVLLTERTEGMTIPAYLVDRLLAQIGVTP
jgi:hypothetical protein